MIRFGRDLATEASMAGKDISVKKYVARLNAEEREGVGELEGLGNVPDTHWHGFRLPPD